MAEPTTQGNNDPFHLSRFVRAQESIYEQALAEIKAGDKRSHWMWFIFPQMAGLGHSDMAQKYAIQGRDEGVAYLAHPVLGPRLRECAEAALAVTGRTATQIFGHTDALKLRSSATLFAAVSPPDSPFERVLAAFYRGERDDQTLRLLGARPTMPGESA